MINYAAKAGSNSSTSSFPVPTLFGEKIVMRLLDKAEL